MENDFERIAQKRRERDKLFAALERKLDRILAATDAKGIVGKPAAQPSENPDERLAILGEGDTIAPQRELADVAVYGRKGGRKNPCRRGMGERNG